MTKDLLRRRRPSTYTSDDHCVFASETVRGMQSHWPDSLMKRHIRPVAKETASTRKSAGILFATLLKANGESVKTVQELLRHANSGITLDVYTQAANSNKRAARSKAVKMMISSAGTKKVTWAQPIQQNGLKLQAEDAIIPSYAQF